MVTARGMAVAAAQVHSRVQGSEIPLPAWDWRAAEHRANASTGTPTQASFTPAFRVACGTE